MPVDDLTVEAERDAFLMQSAQRPFLGKERPTGVSVAVSGGSDSVGALLVMMQVARMQGFTLHAVTVDHALRDRSAAEAAEVAQLCASMGVPHAVLVWQHGAVAGNLMDAARRARYGLMADWAAGQGISHIVLGHTADDHAETFLMGLARKAGIGGLVGMQSGWNQGGVRFMRPFLSVERKDLRSYLTRRGVSWMDDPSNENDRFTRIKARRALKALKPLGITVETLGDVIHNLRMAQDALETAARDAAMRVCSERAGEVVFDRQAWDRTEQDVQRRLLIAALRWISGAGYAPRGSGVDRVMMAIAQGHDATLAGCRIRVSAAAFRVVREPRAVAGLISVAGDDWDGRWQVDGPFAAGQEVRALGPDGLRQCKGWKATGHSRDSLLVSPAVWYDDVVIAAPLAGFPAGFDARIVAPFNQFVLSH
ncbi:tRNA lysidine(34) synthetase TilS [Pseudorhodobacter ferrugineus]|uniref:tRNA lysidine(34) synthetase TilS n=1 Tax=Pseudorhodobacter ferrugineus TaxID=77008 RepID=UPI0003B314EC|nr:tRNA lysidine(34) synthetase TilS [Pseudorhodobacter ferrugineus]